jgi:hypothetical protein
MYVEKGFTKLLIGLWLELATLWSSTTTPSFLGISPTLHALEFRIYHDMKKVRTDTVDIHHHERLL